MLSKIKDNIWSFSALAILGLALFTSKGGLAAVMPVVRLLIPVVVILFIFNFIKKKLAKRFEDALKTHLGHSGGPLDPQKMAEFLQNRGQKNQGQVIDLCSKCGSYLSPGHRCKK